MNPATATPSDDGQYCPSQFPFLAPRQAAEYLCLSRSQIYALVRTGMLRAYKAPGMARTFIDRGSVDDYVAKIRASPFEPDPAMAKGHALKRKRRADVDARNEVGGAEK
jgi:excisionase family DNA binding protein